MKFSYIGIIVLAQFYHAIKRHNAAFEREIVPLDLLTPQFVQPNRDNPRILKQDGAFIISGLDASDKEDFGCGGTKECYHMIKMVGCLKILKRILFTILVEG